MIKTIRIPVFVRNISHLFCMTKEFPESDKLHLLLFSSGTPISDNAYLQSLGTNTKLNFYVEEHTCKLSTYFDLKRHLHFKSIFHSCRHWLFFMKKLQNSYYVVVYFKQTTTVYNITCWLLLIKLFKVAMMKQWPWN